jgi:penicillin-binding protein 1C
MTRKRILLLAVVLGYVTYFVTCLPKKPFNTGYSKLLLDRNGELLEARIASDEQWRFPMLDSIPSKAETCILQFEDKYFRKHPGVNLVALLRAMYLNVKHRKVVSGGSTITMQTVRLMRKNKPRTVWEKLIEIQWALRLELSHSKDEILKMYLTHAPFGGNVVGLETASWRYFNRSPAQLSWGEAAMLAVLPNAPGLIHLGKNRDALLTKRNALLNDLFQDKLLSENDFRAAITEPLPKPINSLPHHAYHFVNRYAKTDRIISTIDLNHQSQFNQIAQAYNRSLKQQNINNLSAVLIDVRKQEVLAYVGNVVENNDNEGGKVDMLNSVRSSGSILKPLLYCGAMDNGFITPKELLPDYPMNFYGYRPTNYNPDYDGLVPANEALFRSLNIPAAWLLGQYGVTKMKSNLQSLGFTSINRPVSNYGLSLVLGGAEVNLLELTAAYAGLAYKLNYPKTKSFSIKLSAKDSLHPFTIPFATGNIFSTLNALTNTYRPETEAHWKNFSSGQKIAWKTGTSFGNRDAWAVGVTATYAIGVWAGNSTGKGVSGLTGLNHAAPLLFQLFNTLETSDWFQEPSDVKEFKVCTTSGKKAGRYCRETQMELYPETSSRTLSCSYHKAYTLNQSNGKRAYRSCAQQVYLDTFFVLHPIAAHYYEAKHPFYKPVPAWDANCQVETESIDILYPIAGGKLSLPVGGNGLIASKVFYNNPSGQLHWELNKEYLGSTIKIHEMQLAPQKGINTLCITNEDGISTCTQFEVAL